MRSAPSGGRAWTWTSAWWTSAGATGCTTGIGTEKDTKTHQMRRIALDNESVVLLTEHKKRCAQRMRDLGAYLSEDRYVFSSSRSCLLGSVS